MIESEIMQLPDGHGLQDKEAESYLKSRFYTDSILYFLNNSDVDESDIPEEAEIRLHQDRYFYVDRRTQKVFVREALVGPKQVWATFIQFIKSCRPDSD